MLYIYNIKIYSGINTQLTNMARNAQTPLCKISFTLDGEDSNPFPANTIQIYKGMTLREVTSTIGQLLGCGYESAVQQMIKGQMVQILKEGQSSLKANFDQEQWRYQMEKVLSNQASTRSNDTFSDLTSQISQNRNKPKYFQFSYDRIFRDCSQKNINYSNSNKQNYCNIYQRSIAKQKRVQQKISLLKKNHEKDEIKQCTFTPNIKNTMEFISKKSSNKLVENNRFQKLYQQSFQLEQKRKERVRTLQNEEQMKLSNLSFAPSINQCSRQICRMKSYGNFFAENDIKKSNVGDEEKRVEEKEIKMKKVDRLMKKKVNRTDLCQWEQRQRHAIDTNIVDNKVGSVQMQKGNDRLEKQKLRNRQRPNQSQSKLKREKQKDKGTVCTFKPKISENTKKMTKNLPSFYQRLQINKGKKSKQQSINNQKEPRLRIKKQFYTIQDQEEQQKSVEERQTEKKKNPQFRQSLHSQYSDFDILKNQTFNPKNLRFEPTNNSKTEVLIPSSQIKHEKRSKQLFNNRKKLILDTVVDFLLATPYVSPTKFSQSRSLHKAIEIDARYIQNNPYLPSFVKEMLEPIISELRQLQIQLSQEELKWALEKLFEELSIGDRGTFLGWGIKLLPSEPN